MTRAASSRLAVAAPAGSEARLEHVACNLCGCDDQKTVYEARPANEASEAARDLTRVYRASGDELLVDRLVQCAKCGLEYISPRPSGDVIVEAYADGDDHDYVSQADARQRTFEGVLAHIEKLHPARGRLLDVGTAAGAFLAAARPRGWDVEGCEPNRWLAQWGSRHYGLFIRQGQVFDQDFPPESFDVVTLWDVIEHTPDPSRVVRHLRTLLKPGGTLIINYPDRGSWIARLLGRKWPFLSSVHLYYFTRQTIARLLERHGFTVIEMRPHVQRLELGYLLARGAVVSETLSRGSLAVARLLGLTSAQVPYWIGQTFVSARKAAAHGIRAAVLIALIAGSSTLTDGLEALSLALFLGWG